jgi:hypothetical protein
MCAVRRGIDERDYAILPAFGGCCARQSTGHALDAATLPRSVTNSRLRISCLWRLGKGILSALANTLIGEKSV